MNCTIYSLWNSKDCMLEYYSSKGSAQNQAIEYIKDYVCDHGLSQEQHKGLIDTLFSDDSATYRRADSELVEVVAIDKIIVLD